MQATPDPKQSEQCVVCGAEFATAQIAEDHVHGLGTFTIATCSECGAGTTLPRVSESALASFYPQTYYTHTKLGGVRALVAKFTMGRRQKRLGLSRGHGRRLLEIGPGDCSFLASLRAAGWQVTGLDPDPAIIKNARASGLEVVLGTATNLPRGPFDAVLLWHSLEHSTDPARDIRLIRNVLAPGGLLVLGLPDFGSAVARLFGSSWYALEVPRHRTHFTRLAVRKLLEREGYRVRRIRSWLSPYSIVNSCRFRNGLPPTPALLTAMTMIFGTPVTWLVEIAGRGDCMSIEATISSRA